MAEQPTIYQHPTPTPYQSRLNRPLSVTDDLLTRLNAQVPQNVPPIPPLPPPPPAGTLQDYSKVVADMEEKFASVAQQINEKFKELEANLGMQNAPSPEEVKNQKQITESLQAIVDTFNKSLEEWYKETGCVVNFGWNYNKFKKLEIAGIDFIVYRKEPPSDDTIREILTGDPS